MTNRSGMKAATVGLHTKSDQIRALTKKGYKRQEIADYLGIRYQHVRNVQVQSGLDYKSFQEEVSEWKSDRNQQVDRQRIDVDAAGRILIPAAFRQAMGAEPGTALTARIVDGELRLMTPAMAVRRAQKLVRALIPGNDSLADSLIADRRKEAVRESSDG